MSHQKPDNILKQPTAVWAVAFASVIAFMGIGLVDPILPAIAASLQATPTQTEMLFTSYLLITGVAMFFTSWISSRIGAKRTLLIGLALIVVFALAAGLSQNVWSIIGFRAGWGLGNALFISTALATIVGAAAAGRRRRSSSTRRRWDSASPSARCSAACWAAGAGADRSSARRP